MIFYESITAYTAAFLQSGSSYAGIRVISTYSVSDMRQAVNTGAVPLLFNNCFGFFKSPAVLV